MTYTHRLLDVTCAKCPSVPKSPNPNNASHTITKSPRSLNHKACSPQGTGLTLTPPGPSKTQGPTVNVSTSDHEETRVRHGTHSLTGRNLRPETRGNPSVPGSVTVPGFTAKVRGGSKDCWKVGNGRSGWDSNIIGLTLVETAGECDA